MTQLFQTPKDQHYFLGYYDKSAVDAAGRYLLALQVQRIDRLPDGEDTAVLGYFDWW